MSNFTSTSTRIDLAITEIYNRKLGLFDTCNEIRKLHGLDTLSLGQFCKQLQYYKNENSTDVRS